MNNGALTRGALARGAGVNPETVRYYEQQGLLPEPPRSPGGHRVYNQEHLRRLSFIRRSRELGFSLMEIRELLSMVDGGHFTCKQIHDLTLAHLTEVRDRIADLQKMATALETMLAECEQSNTPACPVVDALFEKQHAPDG